MQAYNSKVCYWNISADCNYVILFTEEIHHEI